MVLSVASAAANNGHGALALPPPGIWQVDPAHSSVEFIATHLLASKVRGRFTRFEARISVGESPESSSVLVSIEATSIATGHDGRDNHLRGADFLAAATHPRILFVSRAVEENGTSWRVHGDLTLRGITRAAIFEVQYRGLVADARGNEKALFCASAEVDREAFGLTWNQPLPGGGAVLGRSVRIEVEGQATRVAAPSLYEIAHALEPVIREHADAMDRDRAVPPALVDLLYESGVFRTFLPRELGGLEVNPLEWLEMVEELSRIDGSIGWLAMINAGQTRLGPDAMRAILAEKGRWITSSNLGRVGGVARRVPGGYRVSGRWPFCSGVPHSVYMSGLCVLHDENDQPLPNPADGKPWIIATSFPAEQGQILDTWDGLGLRATGSHDVVADDIFVPEAHVALNHRERAYPGPLFRGQFLLMAHAAHAIGIARAAVDAYIALCQQPPAVGSSRQSALGKTQLQQTAVGKAETLIGAARLFARDAVSRAYAAAEHDGEAPYDLRVLMTQAIIFAVRSGVEAVDLVYEAAGASSVYRGTILERCFRDMHTAAQHIIVTENRYEGPGQYYLTRDQPGGPSVSGLIPF